MKKVIVVVVALLVNTVIYGADYWYSPNPTCIRPISGYTHVGIGTSNPAAELHVNGTALMTGFRLTTGAHSGYVLTSNSSGVGTWQPAPSGGAGSCLWDEGSGSSIYYNSGNVGIGTSSPIAKLGIANLGASNGVSVLAISENTTTLDEFIFKGDFAGTGETGNLLKLETHWVNNAMTWRGDGNVGIGTTNPEDKLDINGTVKMSGFKLTTGSPQDGDVLTYNSTSGEGEWESVTGGGGSCLWDEGSDNNIYYNEVNGNVGIGTDDPITNLHVQCDKFGPFVVEERAAIFGYNTGYHQDYPNPIGVYGKVSASDGKAIYGNAESGGYGGYFKGRGYFSGNVGIGTTDPINKFHVQCNASAPSQPEYQWAAIYGYNTATDYGPIGVYGRVNASNGRAIYGHNPSGYAGFFIGKGHFSGKVGIGTMDPGEKLDVNGNLKISGNSYLVGNVGIGTTSPQSKLAVNGIITAKEIIVTQDGWPDFVFSDKHKLMPIDKLEKHIRTNKSLPGIPTEKEVAKEGVALGEMQAKLLEKIEELTLYVIELKKENTELKNRISALEK